MCWKQSRFPPAATCSIIKNPTNSALPRPRCQIVASTQSFCISSCLFLHRFCYPVVPVFPRLTYSPVYSDSGTCLQSLISSVLLPCPGSRSTASLDSAPNLLTRFLISLLPASASVWLPYYLPEITLDCTPSPILVSSSESAFGFTCSDPHNIYIVLLETLFAEFTACYACEKQG